MITFNLRRRAFTRSLVLALTLALAVPLASVPADARMGGGFSFGSRGSRTFSMPPSTATAPRAAQPIQRSATPSSSFGAAAAPSRRFGFGTGLAAGLLGAGLFGMLTGQGFLGGIADLASFVGLLFQIALIGGLIWLALRMFRGRPATAAFAGRSAGLGMGGSAGFGAAPRPSAAIGRLEIGPNDFAYFERALAETEAAYGREDASALSRWATPEMVQTLAADLQANRSRGLRNLVSDARLIQGDLAEAWSEAGSDYATVAMRFSTRDAMVERATGRVVSGDPDHATESTELWTFRRGGGGPWLLSAIQQTN